MTHDHHHEVHDELAPELNPDAEEAKAEQKRNRTLGNVRLRHHETNEIILIPTPSNDPNDPLNWSQPYKYYMAIVVCLAMMMCNFLAAGPSIAIAEAAFTFFPSSFASGDEGAINSAISKCAYFFTTTALLQGTGNFLWVPLCNKYGRRPCYIASYTIYLATAVWCIFEGEYNGFLVARILMGVGSGAAETIAPVSIADVFFLHERGTIMAMYNCFLSVGVAGGMMVAGLITINHDWRVIYQVASALIGFVLLLAVFSFPETAYVRRNSSGLTDSSTVTRFSGDKSAGHGSDIENVVPSDISTPPAKETYLQSLKIFHRTYTNESFFKLFFRPFGLICLPPILWVALVQAATIGFIVAVSSNVAVAFADAYDFEPWQVGVCFVAGIIGSLIGIPAGGYFGDWVADFFTQRNGGIRDPEMRLPAIIPSLICAPLALVLYGIGIEHKLHWICPTIGLGLPANVRFLSLRLVNFAISQGTSVALVYVIDSYRPVAGEVTLAVMGFKSLFGFLLSFYTNPWVEKSGYQDAYGAMAGISAGILILFLPLYIWGKAIRHASWNWPVISYMHWEDDREVGE
ncbi:MFS general substrate transporter [Zalerion maritima]|uniref:MFS general substrate transporter n=1 Tax=Zalerion maritima TaxID=339359 RepID=A0AAD5RZZ7_9PEZI|nr:MFS general substrate transporter [Zalerion maritima]